MTAFLDNASVWGADDWVFTRTFRPSAAVRNATAIILVMDSVKHGAVVTLNGVRLGVVQDQVGSSVAALLLRCYHTRPHTVPMYIVRCVHRSVVGMPRT